MSRAIISRAVARVAHDIRTDGMSDLERSVVESAEGGFEGYIRMAYNAVIAKDIKAEKRAIRDANKSGMSGEVCLPGMERGSFPVGIPAIRDGKQMSVHHLSATFSEIEAEVKASRRENNTEDARIAQWEQTLEALRAQPESQIDAPLGEILAAIEVRQLEELN